MVDMQQLHMRWSRLCGYTKLWLHRVLPGREARNRRARAERIAIAKTYTTPTLLLPNSMPPEQRRAEAQRFVTRTLEAQALPDRDTRVLVTLEPAHPQAGDAPREWFTRRGDLWAEKLEEILAAVDATPFETASHLKIIAMAPFTEYLVRQIQAQQRSA